VVENLIIHPGIFLIFLFVIYDLLPKSITKVTVISAPIVSYLMFYFRAKYEAPDSLFYYQGHTFSLVTFFLIVLLAGILFAFNNSNDRNNDIKFSLLYCGAALSAIVTNSMIVSFAFIEVMLLAATFLIFNGHTKSSRSIGISYFKIHMLSGTMLFIGIMLHYLEYKSFSITKFDLLDFSSSTSIEVILSRWMILVALLINLGIAPFSYWLSEGYAASSPVGSVFLSAYTTKVAIFLLTQIFIGNKALIYIGIFMGVYGIIYSAIENNLRKIISFNIISQSGLILIALGIGDAAAKDSAMLMAINGTIYTALAMMCMGVVIISTNKQIYSQINHILYDSKFVFLCCASGLASLGAIPFTGGYIGKYLLYRSEYLVINPWLKYVITSISTGIMFSVTIKVLILTFITDFKYQEHDHDKKENTESTSLSTYGVFALFILAFFSIITGIIPEILLHIKIDIFDTTGKDSILLFLGALAGFLVAQKFIIHHGKSTLLQPDWIYRHGLFKVYCFFSNIVFYCHSWILRFKDKEHSRFTDIANSMFGKYGVLVFIKTQQNFIVIAIIVLIIFFINSIY